MIQRPRDSAIWFLKRSYSFTERLPKTLSTLDSALLEEVGAFRKWDSVEKLRSLEVCPWRGIHTLHPSLPIYPARTQLPGYLPLSPTLCHMCSPVAGSKATEQSDYKLKSESTSQTQSQGRGCTHALATGTGTHKAIQWPEGPPGQRRDGERWHLGKPESQCQPQGRQSPEVWGPLDAGQW